MNRKLKRSLPTVIGLCILLFMLRIFCVIPSSSCDVDEHQKKDSIKSVVPVVEKKANVNVSSRVSDTKVIIPDVKTTVKTTPKHEHGNEPHFDPNKVNTFRLFHHYPMNVDMTKLVSSVRQGQKLDVEPLNTHPYKLIMSSSEKCKNTKNIFLVILIKTRPDSFERRQALRNTWGNGSVYGNYEVRTLFMIAISNDKSLQTRLIAEENKHKDIIQEDFVDHYFNNTKKLVMGLKWASTHCPNARYVMLADDDMMIIPTNVIKLLSSTQVLKMDRLYTGYAPLHPVPSRQKAGNKWYLSPADYPLDRFPPYITTGALLMNMETVKDFYIGFQYTKMINFDDVYLGIVAKKLGIEAIHCDFVYPDRKNYDYELYKGMIASHGGFKPHELQEIWRKHQKDLQLRKF